MSGESVHHATFAPCLFFFASLPLTVHQTALAGNECGRFFECMGNWLESLGCCSLAFTVTRSEAGKFQGSGGQRHLELPVGFEFHIWMSVWRGRGAMIVV